VLGEREAALEMAGYTLRRFGVAAEEVQRTVEELRRRATLGDEEPVLPPASAFD